MPQLEPRQAPPPDYYANNLSLLIEDVAERSGDLLNADERAFIEGWRAAGIAARRLFARLLTRKGPWFRLDRLAYDEVPDRESAVAELCALGLACSNPPAPADALLGLFTRAELVGLYPGIRAAGKAAWIDACVVRYPDEAIRRHIAKSHPWIAVAATRPFAVCSLLFFGTDRQDLTDFVLQDLGILRFERYDVGPQTRPFTTRAELDHYLRCRRLAELLSADENNPQVAAAARRQLREAGSSRTVARLRDRLLNRLGQLHERRGEFDEALECYGLSAMHPARERCARLLQRLGDEQGFAELVAAARAEPWSAQEEDFALRACARPAGGRRRAAPSQTNILLDSADSAQATAAIETFALAELTAEGGQGWHLENALPLGLAGLLFWQEIFAPVQGAFSHPMQLGPRDLFWPDFARARAGAIAARAQALRQPGAFRPALLEAFHAKRGTANRLVPWGLWSEQLVVALAALPDPSPLLDIACRTIVDLERSRVGFPDLTIVDAAGEIEFVEVKGPADQLQPAQRTWLRRLEQLGIRARVLKYRA